MSWGKRFVCQTCGVLFVRPKSKRTFCSLNCYYSKTPQERFFSYVKKTNGCWKWKGGKDKDGYGLFGIWKNKKWKTIRSHRYMYETVYGPISNGRIVRHKCDNTSCVNPSHLLIGTNKDNTNDMMARGRSGSAKLINSDIPLIRMLYANKLTQAEIALLYGVHNSQISQIINNKQWTHVMENTC